MAVSNDHPPSQHADTLTRQQLLKRQLDDVQRIGHVGIWECRPASRTLFWSEETCRIMGIDSASFDGSVETYIAAVHPEDRQQVREAVDDVLHGRLRPVNEHRILRPNGEVRHLLVQGSPFYDVDGEALVFGTIHDITELRRSAEALEATSRELVDVLDNMGDAFYTLDRSWRFTYLNKQADRLLQRQRGELMHKVVWEEYPDLVGKPFEAEYRRAMQQRTATTFELFYEPLQRWMEVRVFPSQEGLAVYFSDISERKRLLAAERENAERFRLVARTTSDVIWDWEVATDHIWWNEGIQSVFGYDVHEFDGGLQAWVVRIKPDERERVVDSLYAALKTGESWCAEYAFLRGDGTYADVCDRAIVVRDSAGKATHVIGAMVDVTEQKRAEEHRRQAEARVQLQASLLDKAHDAISVSDMQSRITFWNRGAERLFGWTAQEALGKTRAELLLVGPANIPPGYEAALQHGDWSGEVEKNRKDGGRVTVESHLTLVRDDEGQPQSLLEIETDITQRKKNELEIVTLAFFDPLTQLPNRRLLLDRLRHALATCRRDGHTGALLFLDLDNFKSLNDTLGHDMGDLLLQQVAQRLQTRVPRASDTVARHGGDEFVIVLEDLSMNPAEAAAQAERVAEKVRDVFQQPFNLNGHEHYTSPSVGVALFDKHIGNVDEVLKRADLAMYQAKAAGRNAIRFFDLQMQTYINTRVELEAALRRGLQRHEFCLRYQRQTDSEGATTGAEALLRWIHPQGQLVSPALFIPLAEETGLILQLGQWVLEQACKQLVTWSDRPATAHLTVAVNVSARQFRQPGFVHQVLQALDHTGADPSRLKLELTESLLVANLEKTVDNMNALKAKGIGFALDDFGTGYSSLAYLKRLPLDQLKIDQSFVRDVLTDPNDAAIARTILGLGHTLGLDVIAEGVETQNQRDFLAQNGCRAYQGYLFGPPVEAEQF